MAAVLPGRTDGKSGTVLVGGMSLVWPPYPNTVVLQVHALPTFSHGCCQSCQGWDLR